MILFILIILKISQILGIEEIYLTPNEYLYFDKKSLILLSNDTCCNDNIDQIPEKQQQFKQISSSLLNVDQTYDIDEKIIDVITFVDHNEDDQYICLLNKDQIDCTFRVSNLLVNSKQVIQKGLFVQIPTISLKCLNVFNILQNIYIIQCLNEFGQTFKLLNQNNKLLDTLIIRSKYKEQQNSVQDVDKLIIYEINEQICHFSIIKIHLEKFHFLLTQFTLDLRKNYSQSGVINNLNFKQHNYVQVFYEYLIIKINLLNFEIQQISEIEIGEVKYYNLITINENSYYLMLILNYQFKNTINLIGNTFYYNLSKGKILKSEIINQNLVLILTNYIIIFNNNHIQLEFFQEYKSIHFLKGLPYLIVLTLQNNLQFISINDLPNFIQYSHSQYLSIYQFDYFFQVSYVLQYKVNLYSLKNPKLLMTKVENSVYVFQEKMFQYICYFQAQGLPFSISQDLKSNNNQVIKQLLNSITIEHQQINQKLIIFSTKEPIKYLLFIFDKHNVINIFDQILGLNRIQKIPFFSNNSQIYSSISKYNFVIVNNLTIIGFQYQDQLKESWVFRISVKIVDIVQNGNNLAIQLEECKEIKIDLENMIYQQMNQSFQLNCTYPINNNFFITIQKKEIKINKDTQLKSIYTFNTLLQFIYFVNSHMLILFELQDAQIIIKLYHLSSQKLHFYYNLPSYNFEIIQPIIYKVVNSHIAVIVKNQMDQHFVMIYNINYQAAHCLIRVIEIDPYFQQFNFIDQSQIYVYFNKSITVYFLQWVFLNLTTQYIDLNTFHYKQFVDLQKKSDILFQTENITVQLKAINKNQQLQLKNQSNPVYYTIRQNKKEIRLDNIFGNIDLLEHRIQNELQIALNPIIIVDQYCCLLPYYNQICKSQNDQIVLNFFDKNNQVFVNLPEISFSQYQFFRKQTDFYELFLQLSNKEGRLYVINKQGQILNNKTISIHQVFPNSAPSDSSITVVGNLGIYKSHIKILQVFIIQENGIYLFYHFDDGDEVISHNTIQIIQKNNNYIVFNSNKLYKNILIVYILNDKYRIIEKVQIQLKHLIPEYDFQIFSSLIQIQIIDFEFFDLIFEGDLILCFQFFLCQRMNIQINFNNKQIKSQTISYIRYPNFDYAVFDIILLSDKYLIIQFQSQKIISYFYNLQNKSEIILDSFYQQVKDVQIQQHTQAQYIEIEKIGKFVELKLVNIQAYTIQCQQTCYQSLEDIQIKNQVSNFKITLYPKIEEEQNLLIQYSIIILNFIVLLIYLKLRINKKTLRNQNNI